MLETLVRHLDMVRLSVGTLAIVALVGCTGLIENANTTSGTDTPEQLMAKAKWLSEAEPQFKTNCSGCHGGSMADVAFLAGSGDLDIRTTLLGFDPQVVDLDAPESSRVLTKGLHDGPALLADQASAILDWVQAEKAAVPTDSTGPVLQTAQVSLVLCTGGVPGSATCPITHVPLDPAGLTGATIDFVPQAIGGGLYVNELQLTGAAAGAYIEHPLFVSWPAGGADPLPDDLDRFFDVKLDVMPTTSDMIDGGTAAFVGFLATDPITIHFKVVTPYVDPNGSGSGSGSDTTSGCKQLATFKTDAQPQLLANCATCHTAAGATTNASAIAAMDLDGVAASDDPTILLACNQVRSRINFQTPDQSGFFIAPNPADNTNHPLKLSATLYQSFHDAVDPWVLAEQTSP